MHKLYKTIFWNCVKNVQDWAFPIIVCKNIFQAVTSIMRLCSATYCSPSEGPWYHIAKLCRIYIDEIICDHCVDPTKFPVKVMVSPEGQGSLQGLESYTLEQNSTPSFVCLLCVPFLYIGCRVTFDTYLKYFCLVCFSSTSRKLALF